MTDNVSSPTLPTDLDLLVFPGGGGLEVFSFSANLLLGAFGAIANLIAFLLLLQLKEDNFTFSGLRWLTFCDLAICLNSVSRGIAIHLLGVPLVDGSGWLPRLVTSRGVTAGLVSLEQCVISILSVERYCAVFKPECHRLRASRNLANQLCAMSCLGCLLIATLFGLASFHPLYIPQEVDSGAMDGRVWGPVSAVVCQVCFAGVYLLSLAMIVHSNLSIYNRLSLKSRDRSRSQVLREKEAYAMKVITGNILLFVCSYLSVILVELIFSAVGIFHKSKSIFAIKESLEDWIFTVHAFINVFLYVVANKEVGRSLDACSKRWLNLLNFRHHGKRITTIFAISCSNLTQPVRMESLILIR